MIKLILILTALLGTPVAFDTHLVSVFDIPKVTILYVSSLGLAVVWVFQSTSSSQLRNIPLRYSIIAYLSSYIISTVLSINPAISFFGEYKRYEGLSSTLCYLIIFYSTASISSRKHAYVILLSMIGMSIPIGLYGILQHYGHDYWWWDTFDANRVPSTFGNPVFFAQYLIMIIPIVIVLYFNKGWFFLPFILLSLIALSFTASRAASLGLLISIAFLSIFIWKHIREIDELKIILLVSLIVYAAAYYMPVKNLTKRFVDSSIERRLSTWRTGVEIIKDYPIFGVGPDCVGLVYQKELAKHFKLTETTGGFPFELQCMLHADILDTLATRGIIGLGTYIWLLVSFGILVGKYLKCKYPDRLHRLLIAGLTSGLLAWFIQNQCMFSNTPTNVMRFVYMGLCVSIINLKEKCERN